jgi:hypothetical protein
MMLGIHLGVGWWGFGKRRDFFSVWLDLGVITLGFTPFRAREDFNRIHDALRRLAGGLK